MADTQVDASSDISAKVRAHLSQGATSFRTLCQRLALSRTGGGRTVDRWWTGRSEAVLKMFLLVVYLYP